MKHGCIPIGDGAVDKTIVLIHSKSIPFKLINPADYEKVLKENEQLKETNRILVEENNVNRALIMVITRNGPGVAAYGQCVGYISHHMFVVDADFSSCIEYLLFQIFRLLSLFLIFYLY